MNSILKVMLAGTLVVALAMVFVAPVHAQVTDMTGTSTNTTATTTDGSGTNTDATTSPGLPNTGAGGDMALNVAILLSSGLLAVGAAVLLARRLSA